MKRSQKAEIAIVLIIIIGIFVYNHFNPATDIVLRSDDTGITVSAEKLCTMSIPYTDIVSIELVEDPDLGRIGASADGIYYGNSHNDAWGDYCLLAWQDVPVCIVIRTHTTTCVFNYRDETDTREVYNVLPGRVESMLGGTALPEG